MILIHHPETAVTDEVNEQVVNRETEDLLPEEELAWIVMLFHVIALPNKDDHVLIPACFGILVTKADVLTTCGCVENTNIDSVGTIFLEVKPKTSLIWWDDDYKQVTQIRKHPHCESCFHTTYNNVALLTIEIINTIIRVVEVIPTVLLMPYNGTDRTTKAFRDCFIVSSVTGFQTPRLGSLEVEKFHFTIWDIPIPTNDLGTVIIIGSSRPNGRTCGSDDTRLAGSPLMCRRHTNVHVPVGIYLGLYCPYNFTLVDLRSCNKSYSRCADCFPARMPDNPKCATCRHTKSVTFEVVLLFDSLFNWMDENTIAPAQPFIRKKFRSRTSRTIPLFVMVHVISIVVAFTRIIFE
ncbi:hypothetical protein GE061_003268 [Apolygus lucorum]|uniref:Peptidase S1 domain-containing protein n=1 Tax=Apolygus lucorum TaxID=248454 RepID=A0A6A4JCG9_APOLU|nr:hypothetical protein GE061_003268 [Apolygus lucorum]